MNLSSEPVKYMSVKMKFRLIVVLELEITSLLMLQWRGLKTVVM